jgi:GTPase
MFLDTAVINCKAGNGGDGVVSWHRAKFVPKGGPNGGDGGKGGDIIFMADSSMNTLISFQYTHKFWADDGEPGSGDNCFGRNGKDLIIKVPCGTLIRDFETNSVIADLFALGDSYSVLKGGRGGRGNAKFATSVRRSPGFSEMGEKTKERKIKLELMVVADVGLIGFPNVGKSTILSVISAAKPKIANYHFTTLSPNLGVVNINDYSFTVVDIPGLIEGAAEGAGLGHSFLRHIERVRVLLHIVDISGSEGRNPVNDYHIIRNELKKYSSKLALLPEIVVANKLDLLTEADCSLDNFQKEVNLEVIPISAITNQGITKLLSHIAELLKTLPKPQRLVFKPFIYEHENKEEFKVEVIDNVYYVYGGMMEDLARRVVISDPESFRWFQKVLRDKGVMGKLLEMGLKSGDTIAIMDIEFEYME